MHVGRHDTCQADRVMWMIGAVTAAIVLCRGRSREEGNCAEAGYRGSSKNERYCTWLFPPKSTAATSLLKHRSQQFSVGRLCRTMCGCHIVALCRPSGWARVLQRVVQLRKSPAIPCVAAGRNGEGGIRTHGTVPRTTVFETACHLHFSQSAFILRSRVATSRLVAIASPV